MSKKIQVTILCVLSLTIIINTLSFISSIQHKKITNTYKENNAQLLEQEKSYKDKIDELNQTISNYEHTISQIETINNDLSQKNYELSQEINKVEEEVSVPEVVKTEEVKTVPQETINIEDVEGTLTYSGNFKISYYCNERYPHICGGGNGKTASGAEATVGTTVAADTSIVPMGSIIYIEGIGIRTVQDTGGAIKGNKLDVLVETHSEAINLGTCKRDVWIIS